MTTTTAHIDRLLSRLLFDPQQAGKLAQALTAEQWQHCLERAVSHKILPHVAALYHQYQEKPLAEHYRTILQTHKVERHSWLVALKLAAPFSQNARVMLMKGFGHEMLYPEKMERFAKDLDVVVADFSAFCQVATQLLNNGFDLPFMSQFVWYKQHKSWQGLARFIHDEGNEDGGVELHIGQLAIDEDHSIDWPLLRAHATEKQFGEIPLCVPDTRIMFTVFFMELATRPECMLRDLYDGYCLCITLTNGDEIIALASTLNDAGLGAQVVKLISAFSRFNQPPPTVLLQLAEHVPQRPASVSPGWRHRLRKTIDRACLRGDVWLRILSVLDRPWAIRLAMRFAFPVYGILLNTDPQPLRLVRQRHYLLLTTPAGTFLLGGVGTFSDEETEYLQSVIASSPFPLTPEPEP